MRKDELLQTVRDYINDEKANYAVLIDGVWGCGKTYLYENILKNEISRLEAGRNERKYNVYISLYGISSVDQLAKELTTNYLLESKSYGDEDKKRYTQLKKAAGIISKTVSFSLYGLNIDLDRGLEEVEAGIQFSNMVICFDDFERCSIPVVDLFGMINNLVEHCNCKVIILADEDNIGKVYANTNVELKYVSLLQNRKIVDGKGKKEDEIGIEALKQLNEKVYSENYIYKDIKEKVIGLTLVYEPDLKEEFDSIINNVVSNGKLIEKLTEKKNKILEYMRDCENDNIRIMRSWLIRFEKIYNVLMKFFPDEEYFDEIFNRFAKYSIRVACAIGKNIELPKWDEDIEIGYWKLVSPSIVEGYKFIDDLYRNSLIDDGRICQAAKKIINEKQEDARIEMEEKEEAQKHKAYRVLKKWYLLEDDEIKKYVEDLKNEVNNDEYKAQDYQSILYLLTILVQYELLEEETLKDFSQIMQHIIKEKKDMMVVEKLQFYFNENQESSILYHKYYDPVHSLIVEKNKERSIKDIKQVIDYSSGEVFYNFCKDNYDSFLSNRSFVSYIDFEKLYEIISTGTIKGIYDVESGFKQVYNFGNLREFYSDDAEQLKMFIEELENIEQSVCGKTRKIAIQGLVKMLDNIVMAM